MQCHLFRIAVLLMISIVPALAEDTPFGSVNDIRSLDQTLQIAADTSGPEATAAQQAQRLLEQSANAIPEAEIEVFAKAANGVWSIRYWVGNDIEVDGNAIALPVGVVAKINATSGDIIYEMTFPDLEIYFDAIPGRISAVTVRPEAPGVFTGTCEALCGSQTAPLVLHFMAPEDYADWRKENGLPE